MPLTMKVFLSVTTSIYCQKKEDVADLTWFYVHTFWPEAFEDKEHYLRTKKHDLEHNREVMYPDEL